MYNSDSDDSFGDQFKNRQVRDYMKTEERALNDINAYTKNNFKSMDECVKYVKRLYDNSKKQPKRSQSEDLKEKIEDLKDEMKSAEKKFARKLEKKDSEIRELQEELESLEKAKPQKDNKDKFQLKELKERNMELEDDLRDKNDVCMKLERKIDNCTRQIESLTDEKESQFEKFKENERQMKKEIKELKDKIYNMVENETAELEKSLKDKQCAIFTITEKMLTKNNQNEVLDRKLTEKTVDLDDCQKDLQNERLKSKDLERKLTLSEKKVKELEGEIKNNRINDFRKKPKAESWYPNWWNHHMNKNKIIQIQCTLCNKMFDLDKIKNHVEFVCANNWY